ncbi:unnamed protein product [Rotaria sordida]|uniref:Helicase C-terminal domain-containing protein n=1 Tax=Rotaria sordida TaxID=392033 RepID=A0A815EX71_9BILA|nr:unnamed protein product [Rotaria sordida]CAF1583601.1 unnamed protein product [Rotaria sordida]
MIGLSATVNNGHEIQKWLKHIEHRRYELKQASSVRRVRLIISHKRFTDLHKYLYFNQQLQSIHPIGLMDSEQLMKNGSLPNDFILSPKETLALYDAMNNDMNHNHIPLMKQYARNIPSLENYFHDDWIIEREKFDGYSKLVCQQFNRMIQDKNDTMISLIKNQLAADLVNKDYPQSIELRNLIIDFVLTLQKNNQLPCIVFTDSRHLCENMAEFVGHHLKNQETKIRQSEGYQEKIEKIKEKQRNFERAKNFYEDKLMKKKKDTTNMIHSDLQLSAIEQRTLEGILPECTLITRAPSETEKHFLERINDQINPELLEYMQRGVAYHHAGVNKSQRTAIEALFRSGYLKIVFSTATLASGIHMPCKTVAFVNDSIWLGALSYRQASGRAGRRGFDLQVLLPAKNHILPAFRIRLDNYNDLVLFVYEQYFHSVIYDLRRQFSHVEQRLPLTNINFKTFDVYDNGTFEYQLNHHYTWQEKTFISPFAGVSGIENDDFLNNYNSLSYDLAYDLDLSPQTIPFFQIDDTYRCNSYAYDFYNHKNWQQQVHRVSHF